MEHGLITSAWWAATPDRNVTQTTKTKHLCLEADQPGPSVPSKKTCFIGLHSSDTMGGKNPLQRSCHLLTWTKVVKHPTKHPALFVFYLWISSIKWICHMLSFARSRKAQRWNEETKRRKQKRGVLNWDWSIFNLCHGDK